VNRDIALSHVRLATTAAPLDGRNSSSAADPQTDFAGLESGHHDQGAALEHRAQQPEKRTAKSGGIAMGVLPMRRGQIGVRTRRLFMMAVPMAVVAVLFGASVAAAASPTVAIDPVGTVGYTTAQVSGTVDPANQETYYGFEYSADPATDGWSGYPYEGPIAAGAGTQNVSTELTDLRPGTEYQLRLSARVFAEFETEEFFSAQPNPTFTTKPVAEPTVSIAAVTDVTAKTAKFHGQINPNAPEPAPASPVVEAAYEVRWHFECTPECPGAEGVVAADDAAHPVTAEVSGLLPGRSYEVRLVAENLAGPKPSTAETFLTPAAAPVVARAYASLVESSTAEVGAKINPEGAQTSYRFQYLSLPDFEAHGFSGASETAATPLGSGNADLAGAAQITGLSPGVTYVYRAIATNAVGTITGPESKLHTPASASPGSACPNEAFRFGLSATLPDCRAYEQVTPVDKNNQDGVFYNGFLFTPQVSAEGSRAAYWSFGAFPGSPAANPFYQATRGATGWSSEASIPRLSTEHGLVTFCAPQYRAYSPDLSLGVLEVGFNSAFGCGTDEPDLVADEPHGFANLFLRDNVTGAYQLVNVTPPGVTPADAGFEGSSADLRHIVFDESAPLTSDAASGNMLYEWSGGSVRLIGLIPVGPASSCSGSDCAPAAGARLGNQIEGTGLVARAVSADGSRVFFRAGGNLYLREGDTTTQIDASHGPGASGGGQFWTATADGSSVFFTDTSKLTADATATGSSPDLYRYDAGARALTDLTVDASDAGGAQVRGVVGASEDGSYLYFVAGGALTTVPNSQGESATAEQPNLYVRHGGTITFIGTLAPGLTGDQHDWDGVSTSRLTPDGKVMAFNSIRSLTGYDNTEVNTERPVREIFLYEAESNSLACASCNPSGARPLGPSELEEAEYRLRNSVPSGPSRDNSLLQRNLSEPGSRLFFNSNDALVPADTNGKQDVYEFENGEPHLISGGQSGEISLFYGASANGDDVLFDTRDRLVGQDTDGFNDLYDARVGGGLASQNPPFPPTPCSGGACKGASTSAPSDQGPGSSTFSGPGNQSKQSKQGCKQSQRSRTKCAKKHHKHRRHKKLDKQPKHHKQQRGDK
jgi:hypothetical protein